MTAINALHEVGTECEIHRLGKTFDLKTPEREEEERKRKEEEQKKQEEEAMAIKFLIDTDHWLMALNRLPLSKHWEDYPADGGGDYSCRRTYRDVEVVIQLFKKSYYSPYWKCNLTVVWEEGTDLGICIRGSNGITSLPSFEQKIFRTDEAEWQEHYQYYSD